MSANVQQWIQNTMNIGDWRVALANPSWTLGRFVAFGWAEPEQQGTYACSNAPLPCTPYPHPGLRLRHPPDLGAGFVIDPLGVGPLPETPTAP